MKKISILFLIISLMLAGCTQEINAASSQPEPPSSSPETSSASESSAPSSDASSQETSDSTSSQENIFETTPPLEDDDFVLYNDSGKKVWWLNQKFKARESSDMNSLKAEAIPGTRYIGRRELRQVTPEEVYFYDVYKFENDVTTIFAFNYVGADMRDMENCYIHAVTTTDKNLVTNRGIKIGDSREKIWNTYGVNDNYNSKRMTFRDSESWFGVYFTMENDSVVQIGLSYFPEELQYVEYPDTYR